VVKAGSIDHLSDLLTVRKTEQLTPFGDQPLFLAPVLSQAADSSTKTNCSGCQFAIFAIYIALSVTGRACANWIQLNSL
jgi:hypothetical protein